MAWSMVATGDMGIGNTTPSSAIVAAVTGLPPALVTGRGTGLDDARSGAQSPRDRAGAGASTRPTPTMAWTCWRRLAVTRSRGLAGVILGACANRMVVVVDGFISGAAAIVAALAVPGGQRPSSSPRTSRWKSAIRPAMRWLGVSPLLDLGLRLGEGTGAALGMMLVEAAVRVHNEMATFAEAGVAEAKEMAAAGAGE